MRASFDACDKCALSGSEMAQQSAERVADQVIRFCIAGGKGKLTVLSGHTEQHGNHTNTHDSLIRINHIQLLSNCVRNLRFFSLSNDSRLGSS